MQITFETTNPADLQLLKQLLDIGVSIGANAVAQKPQESLPAQPQSEVGSNNTDTIVTGMSLTPPPGGDGVSEEGVAQVTPPTSEKKTRTVKEGVREWRMKKIAEEAEREAAAKAKQIPLELPAAQEAPVQAAPAVALQEAPHANPPASLASPSPLTLDDVRSALQAFTQVRSVPEGIAVLKKYNAARVSEVKVEDYAAFVAECSVQGAGEA